MHQKTWTKPANPFRHIHPLEFSYARSSSLLRHPKPSHVPYAKGQGAMNVAVCSRWYDNRPGVAQRKTKPFRKRAFSLLGFSPPAGFKFRVEPMRGHPRFFQLENRMTSEVSPLTQCVLDHVFFTSFLPMKNIPLPKSRAIFVEVSWNRIFPYKASIFGYPHDCMETSKQNHEIHQSYDGPPPATAPQTNDGTMRHKSVATFRVCKANSLVGDRTVAKVPFLRALSRLSCLSWGSYLQIGTIQHEETGTST